MRLWSLHPSLLDRAGIVALWREALLAQQVLRGLTKGYRSHPQLDRFRQTGQPEAAIATYLWGVHQEAESRGYRFDSSKIANQPQDVPIQVTRGQLAFEREHLRAKIEKRQPASLETFLKRRVRAHPMFTVVPGKVEAWERGHPGASGTI